MFWRALITDMDQWVKDGTPPPPNVYPKIADATLVPLSKWAFPKIPGVNIPHDVNLAYRLDFGSHWKSGIISNEFPGLEKHFPFWFRRRMRMETTWEECACRNCKLP